MKRLALQPVELSWVRRHKPGEITCVKRFWLRLPWPLLAWVRRLALRPAGAPVALVVAVMAAADLVAATASEAVVSEAAATVAGATALEWQASASDIMAATTAVMGMARTAT